MKESTDGFTLIELLVTMAIIGMLSAIAIPEMKQYSKRVRDIQRINDMKNIIGAFEVYYIDNETFPGPSAGVSQSGEIIGDGVGALDAALATVMPNVPRDPKHDGTVYYYAYDPFHRNCDLEWGIALSFNRAEALKNLKQDSNCGPDLGIGSADFSIMFYPPAD